MTLDIIRSYDRDVDEAIHSYLTAEDCDAYDPIMGHASGYPLFYIRRGHGDIHVLVTGGVHGEEPAGTLAAVDLCNGNIRHIFRDYVLPKWSDIFTFHIFPCMNPWGYETHKRENVQGIDLNRGFKEKLEGTEVEIFAEFVNKLGLRFTFTIDFHEGSPNCEWQPKDKCEPFKPEDNPRGVWLYESCHNPELRMGDKMVQRLRDQKIKVSDKETIYDDINSNGVIYYPEGMRSADYATQDSFDAWLWANHTLRAYTSETDMTDPMVVRTWAHKSMLATACYHSYRRTCSAP